MASIAIIDVNRLGQRGPTMDQWELDHYRARAEAFGWHAIEIDGHDHEQIANGFKRNIKTRVQQLACPLARHPRPAMNNWQLCCVTTTPWCGHSRPKKK